MSLPSVVLKHHNAASCGIIGQSFVFTQFTLLLLPYRTILFVAQSGQQLTSEIVASSSLTKICTTDCVLGRSISLPLTPSAHLICVIIIYILFTSNLFSSSDTIQPRLFLPPVNIALIIHLKLSSPHNSKQPAITDQSLTALILNMLRFIWRR